MKQSEIITDLIQCLQYTAELFETENTKKVGSLCDYPPEKTKQVVGVCALVEALSVSKETSELLYDIFEELYGCRIDPFASVSGLYSYSCPEIDWGFRAEECRKIVKHLEKKLDEAYKEEENNT